MIDYLKITKSKKNIKTLVWYISFGDCNLTEKSIYSLRTNGKYKGDVLILSDSDGDDKINVQEDLLKKYGVDVLSKENMWCAKTEIINYVDIDKYDVIVYIDSDVVICKDINDLLYSVYKNQNISVQFNGSHNIKTKHISQGGKVLTRKQKTEYGNVSLCAGVFAIPGGEYGKQFISDWINEHKKYNYNCDDQANLCKIIIEKYIENTRYIPYVDWIWYKMVKSKKSKKRTKKNKQVDESIDVDITRDNHKKSIMIHCGFRKFYKVYEMYCEEK